MMIQVTNVLRWNKLLLALALGVLLLGGVLPVQAHGYLVRSIPEDRAQLERAPARVQYWFSEDLEPDFSSLTIRDAAGTIIAEGGLSAVDRSLLEVRLPAGLPDGAYIADLRIAFASDGHVIAASRVFFVGSVTGDIAGLAASDRAVMLEVVWRWLLLSGMTLLLGTYALYALVLVPAWGNPKFRAGLLPPRVMNRLNLLVVTGLALALGANVLALLQQTMVFFGADLGRVLGEGLWQVVRIGTRFGDTWNIRMLLLLIMAALHVGARYYHERQPEAVRAFWVASGWGMALAFATLSLASHAAGSLVLPWLALLSDWLHGAAVGVWIGGIAALVWVLPAALNPLQGDARRQALLAALRRFSVIAVACLFLVVTTGIYSASNWIMTPAEAATTYGSTLLIKVLLVGLLVGLGGLHHVALRPDRFARWSRLFVRAERFLLTLRLEAVMAVVVLLMAGWLSATPVPQPEFEQLPAPTATQSIGDLNVTITLSPGGPGVNSYDVAIRRGDAPVEDAAAVMQMISPAQDRRGPWRELDAAGDGLYISAGDDINQPGDWVTVLRVMSEGEVRQLAFSWTISAEAAVISQRDPSLLTLLALVAVSAAVIHALLPSLRRGAARLDFSPQSVTIALVGLAVTIGIIVVTVVLMEQSTLAYNAAINPPPAVVNPVLPDETSLERGRTLTDSACGWLHTAAYAELLRELPRRDDAVYALTETGWRALPACSLEAPAQRWDIVNFLRAQTAPLSEG